MAVRLCAAVVTALLLCGGCGGEDGATIVEMSDGASLIGAESGEEWVAISDFVAVVRIEDERVERPEAPGEGRRDTGISSYTVVVDRVVWVDPEVRPPAPGTSLEIFGAGWVFRSDGERPFFPHLEIGERYLMPLGTFEGDGLGPLTFESIIPVDGEYGLQDWSVRVSDSESATIASIPGPIAEQLPDDPTVDDVEALLGELEVPTELRRANESPIDRYVALQEQQG